MIIHHPAISNTDSAGFLEARPEACIAVWIAKIPLLRKTTAFLPETSPFAWFELD
jgi:hypothetical protein